MNASIVVCTYNRAKSLKRTLASLGALSVPEGVSWEVVVVDNNSRDATQRVVEESAGTLPAVRYLFERNQGLSYARNRGVQAAQGKVIAFTDDDILVDARWLRNILAAFERYNAACVGGTIIPLWSQPPPPWFTSELFWYLGLLDLGNRPLGLTEPLLWGANFAVRASLFSRYGLFNTAAGRIGAKLYAGEETQFIRRLIEGGERVFYVPDIVVHHYVPAEHLKKAYFRKSIFDRGDQIAREAAPGSRTSIMGVPLQEFPVIAGKVWSYLRALVLRRRSAFPEELNLVGNVGYLVGRIKYRNRSGRAPRRGAKRKSNERTC